MDDMFLLVSYIDFVRELAFDPLPTFAAGTGGGHDAEQVHEFRGVADGRSDEGVAADATLELVLAELVRTDRGAERRVGQQLKTRQTSFREDLRRQPEKGERGVRNLYY